MGIYVEVRSETNDGAIPGHSPLLVKGQDLEWCPARNDDGELIPGCWWAQVPLLLWSEEYPRGNWPAILELVLTVRGAPNVTRVLYSGDGEGWRECELTDLFRVTESWLKWCRSGKEF